MTVQTKSKCSGCGLTLVLPENTGGDPLAFAIDEESGTLLCTLCLLEEESCGCSDETPSALTPGALIPSDDND